MANKVNGHHFPSRNPSFFHLKLSVLHFETVLKFSKFNPITYGGLILLAIQKKKMDKISFFWIFLSPAKFISQNILFLGRKKVQFSLQLVKLVLKFIEKQKIFEKKNLADFANILKIVNFRKSSKLRNLRIFKCP